MQHSCCCCCWQHIKKWGAHHLGKAASSSYSTWWFQWVIHTSNESINAWNKTKEMCIVPNWTQMWGQWLSGGWWQVSWRGFHFLFKTHSSSNSLPPCHPPDVFRHLCRLQTAVGWHHVRNVNLNLELPLVKTFCSQRWAHWEQSSTTTVLCCWPLEHLWVKYLAQRHLGSCYWEIIHSPGISSNKNLYVTARTSV